MSRLLTLSVVLAVASATLVAQSSDPMVGTWKLNAAKSKGTSFTTGTSVITAVENGIKASVDLAGADGVPHHWEFTAKYDGKDNPVTGNSPFGDSVALTRLGANTVQISVKQGGKPTITQTMVVSADGKTRTITTKGSDAKGQPIDSTTVYDKQ
jgi:hypothetical protein